MYSNQTYSFFAIVAELSTVASAEPSNENPIPNGYALSESPVLSLKKNTKTYTKKYSINFWDIEDMELRTLEDILNDPEKYNHCINIDNANSRYKLLNDKNINDLNKELLILQEKIKNKNNRSSMRYSS